MGEGKGKIHDEFDDRQNWIATSGFIPFEFGIE
jgi:hypothetical protein